MKVRVNTFAAAGLVAVVATIMVGCTTTIPVAMNVAGEFKLNGVSKIAIADFNSLPGDPFTGKATADAETCALVKRAVASSFYTSPMYQVIDLDTEKAIFDAMGSRPDKRFDAVIYGRLWWQLAEPTEGQYPCKYSLRTWKKVPDPKTKNVTVKRVLVKEEEVIEMQEYRSQNATLMLTLSIYRIDDEGEIEKIADTYQVSDLGFTLMNGKMKLDSAIIGIKDDNATTRLQATGKKEEKTRTAYEEMFESPSLNSNMGKAIGKAALEVGKSEVKSAVSGALASKLGFGCAILSNVADQAIDSATDNVLDEAPKPPVDEKVETGSKRDPNGKIILAHDTVAMPTALQAKLMLASSVTKSLSAKLAPSKVTFDVPADLGDSRLENLLKCGANQSARDYAMYMLRTTMGKQVCAELSKFLPEFGDKVNYPVPDSSKKLPYYDDALVKRLAQVLSGDYSPYFYGMGTAQAAVEAVVTKVEVNEIIIKFIRSNNLEAYFYAIGICDESAQKYHSAQEYYRFAFNAETCSKPFLFWGDCGSANALGLARVQLALGEEARLEETKEAKKAAAEKAEIEL